MNYGIQLAIDNRIDHAVEAKYVTEFNAHRYVMVDTLPDGDITDYLYIDKKYVYDPKPRPEPVQPDPEPTVWDALDAAYQSGYQEGYTEGVNSAYDQ